MLPQSRVKTPSKGVPQSLREPLSHMNRIAKFLHSRRRLDHDDATREYLQIVRESTRDMEQFIGKVRVLIALEHVMARYGARAVARDAKSAEPTFYFKIPTQSAMRSP